MFAQQRASTGADFLPHLQQRVVAISCVLRTREQLKVWSLGEAHSSEAELLRASSTASTNISPSSCRGTAAASICRCCITARSRPACRRRAIGRWAMRTQRFAITITSIAFTGGTSISWTFCRAFSRAPAPNWRTSPRCWACPASSGSRVIRSGRPIWRARFWPCGAIARPMRSIPI